MADKTVEEILAGAPPEKYDPELERILAGAPPVAGDIDVGAILDDAGVQQTESDTADTALAFIEGVGSTVFASLPTRIGDVISPGYGKGAAQRKADSPIASGLGSTIPYLIPVTSGVGAVGALSSVRALPAAAQAVIGGATAGVNEVLAQQALEEASSPDESADLFSMETAQRVGGAAALGGVVGGVVTSIPAVVGKIRAKIAPKDSPGKVALMALGAEEREIAEGLTARGVQDAVASGALDPEIGGELLRQRVVSWTMAPKRVREATERLRKTADEATERAVQEADDIIKSQPPGIPGFSPAKLDNFQRAVQEVSAKWDKQPLLTAAQKDAASKLDEMGKWVASRPQLEGQHIRAVSGQLDALGVEATPEIRAVYGALRDAVDRDLGAMLPDVNAPGLTRRSAELVEEIAEGMRLDRAARLARLLLERKQGQEAGAHLIQSLIGDTAATSTSAAAGGILNAVREGMKDDSDLYDIVEAGVVGAIGGGTAGRLGAVALRQVPRVEAVLDDIVSNAAVPLSSASGLSLGQQVKRWLVGGGPRQAAARATGSITASQWSRHRALMQALAADASTVTDGIEGPERTAATEAVARAAAVVADAMPPLPTQRGIEMRPTDAQIYHADRVQQIMRDPGVVAGWIADGSLGVREAKALKTMYPAAYDTIALELSKMEPEEQNRVAPMTRIFFAAEETPAASPSAMQMALTPSPKATPARADALDPAAIEATRKQAAELPR